MPVLRGKALGCKASGTNDMENNNLAPICLFVYSRLIETKMTVESLKKNFLASESRLFIFCDGPKSDNRDQVRSVREYVRTIQGFASVTVYESDVNKGLANSIISGVNRIFREFNKIIVLEDDLLLSTNFLCYMNQSLNFYEENKRILSVSGYSLLIKYPYGYEYDVALSFRASSWGWATWKDRWESIDWEVKSYKTFKYNIIKRLKFNRGGSDMSHLLDKQMSGKINSWAIRFCYHQFEHNMLDVFPIMSKVANVGFGYAATNTKRGIFRFRTDLDTSNKKEFNLPKDLKLSLTVLMQFKAYHSILMRIIGKFL